MKGGKMGVDHNTCGGLMQQLIMHLVGQFNPMIHNEIDPSEVLCEISYRLLRPYKKCIDAMWRRSMFADQVSKN